MKNITFGILGTIGFGAIALVYVFSRASALPVANSIEDFTNEAGVHQNSREQTSEKVIAKDPTKDVIVLSGTVAANPVAEMPNISLPASANLDIPFQSQAPLGNWDMPSNFRRHIRFLGIFRRSKQPLINFRELLLYALCRRVYFNHNLHSLFINQRNI